MVPITLVCANRLDSLRDAGSEAPPKLIIKGAFADSDVDASPSSSQRKPIDPPPQKRPTDDTRRKDEHSEPPSSSGSIVLLESSPAKSCTPGKVDLVSVAGSGAKILLRIAKESSDVFSPLKSVLGGISVICDQYEVRPGTPVFGPTCL